VVTMLTFQVIGHPAPQGSKRHVGNGIMVEDNKNTRPWRQEVADAAIDAAARTDWTAPSGALLVELTFTLKRPRYHYRTGRYAGELRDNAPVLVDKKPDVDKLARATLDALTSAGVIRDDAQIARLYLIKRYGDPAGVLATIETLAAPRG
jgi:Holliday junction resolvase RusA-like endonuclease